MYSTVTRAEGFTLRFAIIAEVNMPVMRMKGGCVA